jgi:hypothetical protein
VRDSSEVDVAFCRLFSEIEGMEGWMSENIFAGELQEKVTVLEIHELKAGTRDLGAENSTGSLLGTDLVLWCAMVKR